MIGNSREDFREAGWPRPVLLVLLVLASAMSPFETRARASGSECSCQFQAVEPFSSGKNLPCVFDHPAGWESRSADDGAAVQGVVGKPAGDAPCMSGTAAITVSIAKKPNPNAAAMEEFWPQIMKVAGTAECGGGAVTFFNTPGSEPGGQMGGLRFHVPFHGKRYGGSATFSCPNPGEWLKLQELFINTFRTNEGTTFDGQ